METVAGVSHRQLPRTQHNPGLRAKAGEQPPRIAVIRIGDRKACISLLDTPTADRIWTALPLFTTAETWGAALHFEIPIKSGRERTAKLNGTLGEIYYWSDDERILFAFGPTPISRPDEIRLPRPCNVWALALDDLIQFKRVTPGEKIILERHTEASV